MKKKTWVILGATSIIAKNFAHLAAQTGNPLLLVGRNVEQLAVIARDIRLRYRINCEVLFTDFSADLTKLTDFIQHQPEEINLFIAYSALIENDALNEKTMNQLIQVNVSSTLQIIHAYFKRPQNEHRLVFLSSVAACRGRAKNSLYGSSKALIDTYLEGLQQARKSTQHITIARLGFIDTHQTFGLPAEKYAASPANCAKACWQASYKKKRLIYYPFCWRFIMMIIKCTPFFIYRRMNRL
ncbi:SDR family NAD(P)-dependent oxidoreductase [Legionella fairfieldensis]|uniref:SDR family NAD(P)-dependent oxidoreductase n=1 Tax=Legionella fairfieldensis TaxID=45064 RepID=UPI00048C847C|nr:SDR family NAD(P)-dependent oxidoreductase [Legionella fairfieldensis]